MIPRRFITAVTRARPESIVTPDAHDAGEVADMLREIGIAIIRQKLAGRFLAFGRASLVLETLAGWSVFQAINAAPERWRRVTASA